MHNQKQDNNGKEPDNEMDELKQRIAALPTHRVDGRAYLSHRTVADEAAAFLFPGKAVAQLTEVERSRIPEVVEALCCELGYVASEELASADAPLGAAGRYWSKDISAVEEQAYGAVIITGPGRVAELQAGRLVDARLAQHGLEEVVRQYFTIPVTVSDGVYNLMQRAVAAPWQNDWRGLMHDILGMCISGGEDISPTRRAFTVIIRGAGNRRYYRMAAELKMDEMGEPYLQIALAVEEPEAALFELGHVVATAGAAALRVDFGPYLARHAQGDWGDLDSFDVQQNNRAVREGLRILSAYDVPVAGGKIERIWIITEWDRSVTSCLLPQEY